MNLVSARAPARSRICRMLDNRKEIDRLIHSHPGCPNQVSRQVDQLLIESEAIRDFYRT
jgi:hypothetical protein